MIDYAKEFPWLDLEIWEQWKEYRHKGHRMVKYNDFVERRALTHLAEVYATTEARNARIDYAMVTGWNRLVWPNEIEAARRKVEAKAQGSAQPQRQPCVACGQGSDGHSAGVGPTCGDCRSRIARERHTAPRGFSV